MANQNISWTTIGLFIKKFALIIALFGCLGALASYFYVSYYSQPVYKSSTELLVNQKLDEQGGRMDVQSNQQLVNTYSVVLKSNKILNQVIEKQDLDISSETLKSRIKVDNQNNSQVIAVSVTASSPEEAADITHGIVKSFQREVRYIMGVTNVSVLSEASSEASLLPIQPNKTTNITLGLFIGLLVGMLLSLILSQLNIKIKGIYDIERLTDVPILAQIPIERGDKREKA
ncbi:Wzz/FepE/Etk N-terminal domain-containing protein [Listeria rocourtiae]|uniref:YveK family protein n=1 Tax=Listeria rocourtiae TaxID=647910 RepID=UPI003D2F890B